MVRADERRCQAILARRGAEIAEKMKKGKKRVTRRREKDVADGVLFQTPLPRDAAG
jgi:hypothetical protein